MTNNARTINFEGYGADFEIVSDRFEMFTTSATQNLEKSIVTYDDGVVIPAKSIVTLKATLN